MESRRGFISNGINTSPAVARLRLLDLLVHASTCRSGRCQYPNCRNIKELFRHGKHCKTRASGGCVICKKLWYTLYVHAQACRNSDCNVPQCRNVKEYIRMSSQEQPDSRRRAAVNRMMRHGASRNTRGRRRAPST